MAGEGKGGKGSKRVKARDYKEWDQFDVEAECANVDKGERKEDKSVEAPGKAAADVEEKVFHRDRNMSETEKQKLALREKEKGNEAFRSGDYLEALSYYSRSLQLHSTTATHNNRAITFLKLERYQEAVQDCDIVLQLEPDNTKALLRRGTAMISIEDWDDAIAPLERLLVLEPKNKKAQELMSQARKGREDGKAKKRKGRKVQIEEEEEVVDGQGHSKSMSPNAAHSAKSTETTPAKSKETTPAKPKETTPAKPKETTPVTEPTVTNHASTGTTPTMTTPPVTTPPKIVPMPAKVCVLKEGGNVLFHKGQYGEAVLAYSRAIQELKEVSSDYEHDLSMSTLLNNRAACHLKNGSPQNCVEDCTHSLSLSPINIKALVRRAQAYEQLEKYRLAYVDNQLALSLDRSMHTVYAANTRITKLLQDQDGIKWRTKLPVHSHQHLVTQALQHQAILMSSLSQQEQPSAAAGGGGGKGPMEGASTPTTSPPPTPTSSSPPADSSSPPFTAHPIITTSSALNNAQTQVTQSTQSIPTTAPTHAMPTPPKASSSMDTFEKAKAKGNKHIQKGQYVEALQCYSSCIDARPDKVAGYTNRALCHLKLSSPAPAESDCNMALQLDANNVKALYRRALARKSMEKYAESVKDLKQLLAVDQSNSVARAEFEEVKKLWEKQLRLLQAGNVQQKAGTVPGGEGSKKRNSKKGQLGGGDKERKKGGGGGGGGGGGSGGGKRLSQREELENLLARTKDKMVELEKESSKCASAAAADAASAATHTSSSSSSDYLQASNSTYYKKQNHSNNNNNNNGNSKSAPGRKTARRKKVVVEEKEEKKTGGKEKEAEGGEWKKAEGEEKAGVCLSAQKPTAEEPTPEPTPTAEREDDTTKVQAEKEVTKMETVEETQAEMEKMPARKPNKCLSTPYEFMQQWNGLPRDQRQGSSASRHHAAVLHQLSPGKLPHLITNKLEGHMLSSILAAVTMQLIPHKEYQLTVDILENLTMVPRFQTVVMFLENKEKTDLGCVLTELGLAGGVPEKTLEGLRKSYGL